MLQTELEKILEIHKSYDNIAMNALYATLGFLIFIGIFGFKSLSSKVSPEKSEKYIHLMIVNVVGMLLSIVVSIFVCVQDSKICGHLFEGLLREMKQTNDYTFYKDGIEVDKDNLWLDDITYNDVIINDKEHKIIIK